MKRYNIILLFFAAILLIVSCDDFLSERPSKSSDIVPTTYEDMETILVGMWRNDNVSANLVYGGGDVDLNAGIENYIPGTYPVQTVEGATWERVDNGTNKDYMWMYRYQNVFRSNMVLTKLDQIPDVTEADIQRLRSKACFRRAFSYMELLNVYTLPYCEENLEEPGLVRCETPSFDYSLKRMSLKDTYDFIEQDILEALKIDVDLTTRFGQGSPYRVTRALANALASRFYLMKHDYPEAEKYAKEAMAFYGEKNIIDYNTIGYSPRVDEGDIEINGELVHFQVYYPSTYVNYDATTNWTENYFNSSAQSEFASSFSTDMVPSPEHIACFSEDGDREMDARWKYFYVKNYAYLNGYAVDVPYYMCPSTYDITVPEMLLTVAECEARAGDFGTAVSLVNQLRAKRIDPAGQVNLSASNKDEAIALVLRERRREMGPIKRLFDVRRYNSNDYAADDVIVTRHFYSYSPAGVDVKSALKDYVLSPRDRKIAAQIPECDILAGNGELVQNTY